MSVLVIRADLKRLSPYPDGLVGSAAQQKHLGPGSQVAGVVRPEIQRPPEHLLGDVEFVARRFAIERIKREQMSHAQADGCLDRTRINAGRELKALARSFQVFSGATSIEVAPCQNNHVDRVFFMPWQCCSRRLYFVVAAS